MAQKPTTAYLKTIFARVSSPSYMTSHTIDVDEGRLSKRDLGEIGLRTREKRLEDGCRFGTCMSESALNRLARMRVILGIPSGILTL